MPLSLSKIFSPSGNDLRSFLVKGSLGTLGFKITGQLVSISVSIILARILHPKGLGIYAYVLSLIAIPQIIAALGLNPLAVREIAASRTRQEWGKILGFMRSARRARLTASILLSIFCAVLATAISSVFESQYYIPLVTAICLIPFISIITLYSSFLQGLRHVIIAQLPEALILPIVFLVLLAVGHLVFVGSPTVSMVLGLRVLASIVALLALFVILRVYLSPEVRRARPAYETEMWINSAPYFFLNRLFRFGNARASILILGGIAGPEAAGIYAIALRAASLFGLGQTALDMVLNPTVSSLHAKKEDRRLQRIVGISVRLSTFFLVPFLLLVFFFGKYILCTVFGIEYSLAYYPMLILCSGYVIDVAMGPGGLLLSMTGNEQDTTKVLGATAILNLVLSILFINFWGVIGAAFAVVVTITVRGIVLVAVSLKRTGISVSILGKTKVTDR